MAEKRKPLEPGIHPDIPIEWYIADPCPEPSISTGVVRDLVFQSPAHAYHNHPRMGGHNDESSRADLGSAAHKLVLGDDRALCVVDADDWRTKAAKGARDDAREAGQIPILRKDRERLCTMAEIAKIKLQKFRPYLTEQTLIWEEDGIWFRSRPDIVTSCMRAIDYKTADTADPISWARRTLIGGGYDIQAALVLRGLRHILGQDHDFIFMPQEIEAPYCCSFVGMDPDLVEMAGKKIEKAIELWRECMKSGKWPGYSNEIHWVPAPGWAIHELENRGIVVNQTITFGGQEVY